MVLWVFLCFVLGTFAQTTNVFISEIMYNPPQSAKLEYIELYNNGASAVSIANWRIAAINYTFPAGTMINPSQWLVVAKNPALLQRVWALPTTPLGPYEGSLSNKGETLTLTNNLGAKVHIVDYDTRLPWSPIPDGFGSSLEMTCLVNVPQNSPPYHWVASTPTVNPDHHIDYSGTPGKPPVWKVCRTKVSVPSARLLFTEIMYKPVHKVALRELREYMEIFNAGGSDADVSFWRVVSQSGVRYTFPAKTTISAGQYIILAKDPASLRSIYDKELPSTVPVYGPYSGELGNGLSKLAILDRNGLVEEFIEYDDNHGWPAAADAFGANENFLPKDSPFYINYNDFIGRGLSLSRRSYDWPTDKPYNWRAEIASPGKDNTEYTLLPIIQDVDLNINKAEIVAASKPTITATIRPHSAAAFVKAGTLVWYVDNVITGAAPTINRATMSWNNTDASFSFTMGALPANSIVRYRIEVTTNTSSVLVSPFKNEPYTYWAYFVHPPPPSTGSPVVHLFILRRNWGILYENINYSSDQARVLPPPDQCKERESWGAGAPAVMIFEGKVTDVILRHQGSQYQRTSGRDLSSWPGRSTVGPTTAAGANTMLRGLSFKVKLPRHSKVYGHSNLNLFKMSQACTMFETPMTNEISTILGVPGASHDFPHWFTRVNVNGFYYRYMLMLGTDLAESVNNYSVENCLDHPVTLPSSLFKSTGTSTSLGPFAQGDFRVLDEFCGYPPAARYNATYARVSEKEWGTPDAVKNFIEANAAIETQPEGPAGWLKKVLDMNFMLNYHAVIHFAGTWDQTFHNYYFYQREEDKKWFFLIWDADGLMENSATDSDIYSASSSQRHYLRQNINKYLKSEYDSRMRLIAATVYSPERQAQLWAEIDRQWNPVDAAEVPGGWSQDLTKCQTNIKAWVPARKSFVEGLIGTWASVEKTDPWTALEQYKCPDLPKVTRTYNSYVAPPGDAIELQWKSVSSSKVELAWLPPNGHYHALTGYNVTYTITPVTTSKRQAPVIKSTTIAASSTSFSITDPGSAQVVRIGLSSLSAAGSGGAVYITTTTPTDCTWSAWTFWSECPATCGKTGTQTRSRVLEIPAGPSGKPCTGGTSDSKSCSGVPCAVNCVWGPFGDWSPCSVGCGSGTQTRSRTVSIPAQYGGSSCIGDSTESKKCSGELCPTNCTVTDWGAWSSCSLPCGTGQQLRNRTVATPAVFGGSCDFTMLESQACNTHLCPAENEPGQGSEEDWDATHTWDLKDGSGISGGILAASIIIVIVGTVLLVAVVAALIYYMNGGGKVEPYQQL
eukprot:TRINITY_DN2303_c0_g1_i1.p1 TRINITY_DN2303_c0_g1~~TRINITY_DN2303_c0_g1_i1.p1  ORF type:complete len:1295 (-),score=239.23 TRINITY_DN2303_c0_g1_i1:64-3948(-)